MVLKRKLLAQVDRQMVLGERGIFECDNPVYSKPSRGARQEVTGATARRVGARCGGKKGAKADESTASTEMQ